MPYRISDEQVRQYHEDGYILIPDFFSPEQMELLLQVGRHDRQLLDESSGARDKDGGVSRLTLRMHTEQDIYSAFVHCESLVNGAARLLDDTPVHLHHKMMLKEPRVGGAWEWHQDYGYWYHDGYLFPSLVSCMIAVDRASRSNGCLQVLRGSHKLGRIEHGKTGDQTGADIDRVRMAEKRLEHVYVEMEPGTVLFFHCNTLHCSSANTSEDPRWTLICCYNSLDNAPVDAPGHGEHKPLEAWPDERIVELGAEELRRVGA